MLSAAVEFYPKLTGLNDEDLTPSIKDFKWIKVTVECSDFVLLSQVYSNRLTSAANTSATITEKKKEIKEDGLNLQDFISGELSEKSKWEEYRGSLKREKGER